MLPAQLARAVEVTSSQDLWSQAGWHYTRSHHQTYRCWQRGEEVSTAAMEQDPQRAWARHFHVCGPSVCSVTQAHTVPQPRPQAGSCA